MTAEGHLSSEFRAGFVCVVGRPNAGKSTLTNALVGLKVAITSTRPQTTRRAVRGVVNRPKGQLVLVDTPGLHRPRTLLGERLNELVRGTLAEVDVVVFCLPADQKVGPGDRYIAQELRESRTPVVAVATKADAVGKERLMEHLLEVAALGEWADVVPVSAKGDFQLDVLVEVLLSHVPEGPQMYPDGELTDEPDHIMVAELIREAALEGVREELPHSLAVVVEEIVERDQPRRDGRRLLDVRAEVYVERDSQKAIIIGAGGSRLRDIGTRARKGIEALLGAAVYLDLHVRIAKEWQRDPKQLRKLGF
ncbi:GTPase Era [Pseudactinotalea sp.]|uniref:GTPase Era n=1 Tax=Pseudactinotalea sp. TaxID=1926260 RepID=UPI003B3A6175